MSKLSILVFFLGFFVGTGGFAKSDPKTIITSVSKSQVLFLKKVDKRYQTQYGIHMDLDKTVVSEALGTKKNSSGEAWLRKGKMRLAINKPVPSLVVADGKFIWVVNPPPKEFKNAKTQVLKGALNSKRARSQGLIQLLTQGGLLKYFKVVGVQGEKSMVHYFLQPEKHSLELKRAQVTIHKKDKLITELRYWDELDNETLFKFKNTKFNQSLKSDIFTYSPPKDAEVMVF